MSENIIKIKEGAIVVQSCDEHEANIGVFVGERSAYHHVELPALKRQWRPIYSSELSGDDYDAVLLQYKMEILIAILQLCGRPNTASKPTALAAVQGEGKALPAQRLKHDG